MCYYLCNGPLPKRDPPRPLQDFVGMPHLLEVTVVDFIACPHCGVLPCKGLIGLYREAEGLGRLVSDFARLAASSGFLFSWMSACCSCVSISLPLLSHKEASLFMWLTHPRIILPCSPCFHPCLSSRTQPSHPHLLTHPWISPRSSSASS